MSVARAASGKAAKLARSAGKVAKESMGVGRGAGKGTAPPAPTVPEHLKGLRRSKDAYEIPLDRIAPDPAQPRKDFDEEALGRLAESMKAKGQLQPARVAWDQRRNRYLIVAGERRWRAAKRAGLKHLVCTVADHRPTVAELRADQLAENCAREDLGPLELGEAIDHLIGVHHWTQAQIARETGLSAAAVSRSLAIRMLPAEIRDLVGEGSIPASTAYELSKIADLPAKQTELASAVAEGILNHIGVVRVVKRLREGGGLLASDPVPALAPVPAMPTATPGMETFADVDVAICKTALPTDQDGSADVDVAICKDREPVENGSGGGPARNALAKEPSRMDAPPPAPPSNPVIWDERRDEDASYTQIIFPDHFAGVKVMIHDESPLSIVGVLERALGEARKRLAPEGGAFVTRWITYDQGDEIWGYDLENGGRISVRYPVGESNPVESLRLALADAERQATPASRVPVKPVYGVVPEGVETPTYYVRAENRASAETYVKSQHPKGYRFRLDLHLGALPKGVYAVESESTGGAS